MPVKLICVGGARPNFMKLAPLCRALMADGTFDVRLVHTGQHYDDAMSGQFFRDLQLPDPAHHLQVGSGSHAHQTAEVMKRFEPVVLDEKPDGVLVVGDVNSTLACALVAKKLGCRVIHVEAGLRSFDRGMPEEINRLATDAISDLFLVTEASGAAHLAAEGVDPAKVVFVGNLMIDSLHFHLEQARNGSIRRKLGANGAYGLVTLHRPSNVDSSAQLEQIVAALAIIATEVPLYFPVHPRTRSRLEALVSSPRVQLVEPLGYIDFLGMMSGAQVVLTDSGGIQEETTALGIPCLTIRDNTERPVTIEEGTNRLAGSSRESILNAWREHQASPKQGRVPRFWDGQAAGRCREAISRFYGVI